MRAKVCNTILYPDSEAYNCDEVLRVVKSLPGCEWYAVKHDCDTDENGELKKEHIHVVMRFDQVRTFFALAKDLGIEENMIERSKGTFKYAVRYLIHADQTEKYQYDISTIFGNGDPAIYFSADSDEKGMILMDSIYEGKCRTIKALYDFAKEIGAWSEFRRGFSMYNSVMTVVNSENIITKCQDELNNKNNCIEEQGKEGEPCEQ